MKVKIRITLLIILTSIVIVAIGLFMGFMYTQDELSKTMESNLMTIADITDNYVTAEINLLKSDAAESAQRISVLPDDASRKETLIKLAWDVTADDSPFISLAVYGDDGTLKYASGLTSPPTRILDAATVEKAFDGEAVLSTTIMDREQGLVIYVCVPMNDGEVLAAAIPGDFFSKLLEPYVIWQSGHIFIDDAEGTIVANPRAEWVSERMNFINEAKNDKSYESIADTVQDAINGNSGFAKFTIGGVPRYCAYKPITGSKVGWILGVVAPVSESPARNSTRGLLLVGLICLVLSIIAALVSGRFVEKPFEEIRRLREEAERANEAKTNFLANMSHEMRTPLNAVVGLSDLMLGEGDMRGDQLENTEKVHSAGLTLLNLVNDILDMSKVESGQFELTNEEYDPPSLINDVVTLNIIRIESKPVEFRLHVDENMPSRLLGDGLRVKQIFSNILSNAFKYTREGSVDWTIGFELTEDGSGNKRFCFVSEVKDTGIGIKQEDMDSIFGEYNQVDTKANRKIEGTGLGLAITKNMLERMGGSIKLESTYRVGSIFTVRIPQEVISEVPIGRETAERLISFKYRDNNQRKGDKLVRIKMPYAKVLVVDDVQTNLDVARGILKPYGMQVDGVTSGEAAVALVRKADPVYDAIFMGHMMPGMDGMEAVKIIRSEIDSDYARNVPILALTANAIKGNDDIFLANGFQAFLTKPIDLSAMDAALRKWVRDRSKENDLNDIAEQDTVPVSEVSGTDSTSAMFPPIHGLNMTKGLATFSGDEETYMDVLRTYAETTPALLDKVRDVSEAGLNDYAIAVHGIKSSSRSIGADNLGNLAEDLEKAAKAHELRYVTENNPDFILKAEVLLTDMVGALANMPK
jgi:signal transduction histidine kinase/CheY-like chemotaxis protein/HPt (histidine-containing phosphotransfer) domain-containing protein